MRVVYLDSSALVKLALHERGSEELHDEIGGAGIRRCSSLIGRIEFERAVRRSCIDDIETVIAGVLLDIDIIPVNVALAAVAAAIRPLGVRSLDAIHLATALSARQDIEAFYCYDQRLAHAAREHGIDVRSPGLAA